MEPTDRTLAARPELFALCIAANDPQRLARFWQGLLGWPLANEGGVAGATDDTGGNTGGVALLPTDDTGFRLRFLPSDEPKTRRNQIHVDLTSASLDAQESTVARVLELGGRHYDVGQRGDEGHVVLADPEGNEFCVIEPGNRFLAECGFIGALSSDGSRALGLFWSEALGWPLVWDQDEETAIQSPLGGTKVAWGGPPDSPKVTRDRQCFDLVASDVPTEVARLVDLGATRLTERDGGVELADPGGHEFMVAPA